MAGLLFRLSQGPVKLDYAVPLIAYVIGSAVDAQHTEISGAELGYNRQYASLMLTADHVTLSLDDHTRFIVKGFRTGFSNSALLTRFILMPNRIMAEEVLLETVIPHRDGSPRQHIKQTGQTETEIAGEVEGEVEGEAAPQTALPSQNAPPSQNAQDPSLAIEQLVDSFADISRQDNWRFLRQIEFPDITMTSRDDLARRLWETGGSYVLYNSHDDHRDADVKFNLNEGSASSALRFTLTQPFDRAGSASLELDQVRPSALARLLPAGSILANANVPVNGKMSFTTTQNGDFESGTANFSLAAGVLHLGKYDLPVRSTEFRAEIDYKSNSGRINAVNFDIGPHQGRFQGHFDFDLDPRGHLQFLSGQLTAQQLALSLSNDGTDMFSPDNLRLGIELDVGAARLDVTDLEFIAGGGTINIGGEIFYADPGLPLVLSAKTAALPVESFKKLWPKGFLPITRGWFFRNVTGGRVKTGTARLNALLADLRQVKKGVALNAEQFALDVAVRDSALRYYAGLPDITDIDGLVKMRGSRLEVALKHGEILAPDGEILTLTDGKCLIVKAHIKQSEAQVTSTVSGPAKSMLALIDMPPLRLMKKFRFAPDVIDGQMQAQVSLRFPRMKKLPLDKISTSISGRLENFELQGGFSGFALQAPTLGVDVTNKQMIVNGGVRVNDVPLNMYWVEQFGREVEMPTELTVSGELTEQDFARLGQKKLARQIRGPVATSLTMAGSLNDFRRVRINADLTGAKTSLSPLSYEKPAGEPAKLSLSAALGESKIRDGAALQEFDFALTGKAVDVRVEAGFAATGELARLAVPSFKVNALYDADVTLQATDSGRTLSVTGRQIDVSALLSPVHYGDPEGAAYPPRREDDAQATGSADWLNILGSDINLEVSLARVLLNNGVVLSSAKGHMYRVNNKFEDIVFNGDFDAETRLNLVLFRDETGTRRITLEAPDAGQFFKGVNVMAGMDNGYFSLNGTIGDGRSVLTEGYAYLVDFNMQDLPVLAKILSLGSLIGIADALSGEGVGFDGAELSYRLSPEELTVTELRANGPSMGLTLKGKLNFDTNMLAMSGDLYPAYTLNSMVGKIPLVGQVLTGGEGVVGLSYGVKGSPENPEVTVNPLSLLVPEVLKNILSVPTRGSR